MTNLKSNTYKKTSTLNANLVPMVIEDTRKGERAYDIFSRLLKDRIIFLTGSITMTSVNLIIAQMLFLEKENPKEDIFLYINSGGGDVYAGFALYDTIQHIKCDVSTVGMGIVASMASVILASGANKKRIALPHTKIMIHQPWGSNITGKVTDLQITLKEFEYNKMSLEKILEKHTGQTLEKIKKDTENGDFWLNAQQAKEYNLIDTVL